MQNGKSLEKISPSVSMILGVCREIPPSSCLLKEKHHNSAKKSRGIFSNTIFSKIFELLSIRFP